MSFFRDKLEYAANICGLNKGHARCTGIDLNSCWPIVIDVYGSSDLSG